MVKDARVSLMYFEARHVSKTIQKVRSPVLDMGNLVHALALQPDQLEKEFSIEPEIPEGAFTTTATAVFGAYFKLQSFIFMPVFGLNNAMVPILSYNYGARKPERVKKTVKLSIFTAIGIMILGFAAFELIPDVLLELFDASETMLSIGTTALRIIGTHFLIAGINVVAMSVYQAVGDPLYSLLSSVTRQLVVLLPAAWLLARTGRLELVWLAFPIAELAALAMSTIFLRKTLRTAECRMADDDYGEVV